MCVCDHASYFICKNYKEEVNVFIPYCVATKQLDTFDPKFFEELEDLKYNYQQALKKNILYEEKLDTITRQHGIDVSWDDLMTTT